MDFLSSGKICSYNYLCGYPDNWTSDPKPCHVCSKEHPVYDYCPFEHCDICYNVHFPGNCPYLSRIPKGAAFSTQYELVCLGCNGQFDEDKWACTNCSYTEAKMTPKCCMFCMTLKQHAPYECPVDKIAAEQWKLAREKKRSIGPERNPILLKPSYIPNPPEPSLMNQGAPVPWYMNVRPSRKSSLHFPVPRM
ncbi:hypothetical protein OROHE_000746 [Orobanche hederae]